MGDTTSTSTRTRVSTSNNKGPGDSALNRQMSQLQAEVQKLMTKKVTLADLPSGLVTSENFASTFSQQATDSSISQKLAMGGKVGDAVSTWMDAPANQAKIQAMVKTGANEVTAQQFTALKTTVDSLASSGDSPGSGGSGSGLTFNAAQEVGCVRWNWFHNKNTKKCYATNCDPNKTDYPDGNCYQSRSSCTDEITPVRVIDGQCYASLTQDCTEADCQQSCPAGDDAIVMPTQCNGPLILQDIYTPATPAPQPLLQGGEFEDVVINNSLTAKNATVETSLTVGAQTGDASQGSTTGKLVVNGDASVKCPECCLKQADGDCPINFPYAYTQNPPQAGTKAGEFNRCCAVPATGGTTKQNPNKCPAGKSINCPKETGCRAIQTETKNPCPDCSSCGALTSSHLDVKGNGSPGFVEYLEVGKVDLYNMYEGDGYSNLTIKPDGYNTIIEVGGKDDNLFIDGYLTVSQGTALDSYLTVKGDSDLNVLKVKGDATIDGSATIDDKLSVGNGGATVGTGGIMTTGNIAIGDTLFLTKKKATKNSDRGKCSNAVIRFDKTWSTGLDDIPFITDDEHYNLESNLISSMYTCA